MLTHTHTHKAEFLSSTVSVSAGLCVFVSVSASNLATIAKLKGKRYRKYEFTEKSLSYYSLKIASKAIYNHLFKKAIHKRNCPKCILEVIPNSSSQKLIPDKHCLIKDMACLIFTQVPLKTTHNVV